MTIKISMKQTGAALLSAMLTVALVATFATAAMWQQYRSIEIEKAERARVQLQALLKSATDFGIHGLRLDAESDIKNGKMHDSPDEPWHTPIKESNISSFVTADANNQNQNATENEDAKTVFLSGEIRDAQARWNIYNLYDFNTHQVDELSKKTFINLCNSQQIPPAESESFVNNLVEALDGNGAKPLHFLPQYMRQMQWLGLSEQSTQSLAPFVVLIPRKTSAAVPIPAVTPVNINTTSNVVLTAMGLGGKLPTEGNYWKDTSAIMDTALQAAVAQKRISIDSNHFEIQGTLRKDEQVVTQTVLLQRIINGGTIDMTVLMRDAAGVTDPSSDN